METPQIPPNTTARPMLGAPFQPVYPNPITHIPTITATADPSNPRPVFNQLYTLSAGFGEVITYPGRRGVPTPTVIVQKTDERYLVFGVNIPYQMSGTDHFVFTFTSQNTGEQIVKNFQPAPQYIVGGLLPGVLYTLTVAPVVNGITYPGSAPPLGPLTISAVSEKNVQLQGVTLSGGDKSAFIRWINATPQPPLAFEVTTVAVDDNFGTPQRLLNVISSYLAPPPGERPTNYSGYVPITNLINGSAYTFTITPYKDIDGIYEYGRPTTLPPYIPGPPGDLLITAISADGSLNTVTLNVTYDTTVHPVPESTKIRIYNSTLTTVCSLVGQSTTVVQDLSQTYASFTTSTGFFTAQGFEYLRSTISSYPGSVQVDLLNDKGYFYTFPLTDVSTGGLGYTFGNSNFVKTTNLISTASSYSLLVQNVTLGAERTNSPYVSGIGQTVLTISGLEKGLYTFIGSNLANGLSSRVSTYTSIAGGKPGRPQAITGGILSGNQFVSLAFSGYDPADIYPRPISYLYTENSTGKTYTSINSNILIGGLVNGSTYTFGIQGFGNGVYGASGQFTVTPAPQPPINLSASISNYDVNISFAPGLGGADFYQITNQSGQTVGLSGGLYKFLNLSANVGYTFCGKSFVYGSPVYTLTSTDPSTSIVEISSAYAQFLVRPSVATLSYASTMITNLQYFVPYNYTISGGGTNYSFPITSMTPVYDTSANLQWYNIANTNVAKSAVTFSGATTYTTTLSTTVPLFPGMIPTISSGTIASVFSLPTSPLAYVGPPNVPIVTASLASSQRVDITILNEGFVVPTRYNYTEISGKIAPGFSLSPNIVIDNLTNGSSYTFNIRAFGNQVYSTTGVSAGPFVLSTAAPSNAIANFSNTTARVDFSGYYVGAAIITYFGEIIENGYPGIVKQTLSQAYSPFIFSPDGINAGTNYGFRVYGIQNNISSVNEIVNPIIAGAPRTPKNIVSTLSQNQITFNWSSGNAAYNETYTITEYLSNNGVCNATGLIKSGISSQTYTISHVIAASGTQAFGYGSWLERSPGYASFVLQTVTNFTDVPIGSKYTSNQIYLSLQQSGLTYTFPLSTVTPFGTTNSNVYANAGYPKDPGTIFDPLLSISVTYSYGTGPRNGGTYSYAFTSFANQVDSTPSNVGINMFVQSVSGVPGFSVSGTAVTISFAQTNPAGTIYKVTNNYAATVSSAPYRFSNLSTGIPYTFSVVASNGAFVSVSSELTPQIYVGPPPIPLVGATYFGQVATVTAIDTTISLATVFYDTGTQNTGQEVWTLSHGQVIQTSSGGFWNASLPTGYGSIKDSNIGFVATTPSSYGMYSNDGYSNAMYQFIVTPSTGTITATLSAYSLTMTGSSLTVTNAGVQVYSGTTLSPSYTVQFFSYSNGFGIQSGAGGGNNLLYYSQVPAGSDSLVFTMTDQASFSNFQASRIQNVGPATVSYGIVDQFNIVYTPSLQSATYTPNGLQYAYSIFNIPYAITLKFGVTPYANNVAGPTAFVDIYLYTGSPGTPQVSIYNTTATVTVPKVSLGSVDSYFLDIITGGATISTLSTVATASVEYIFQYPDLVAYSNYYFSAYATYNGVPTSTGPVTVGPYQAGKPYSNADFPGLLSATISNPNTTTGTYTISATVDPGKNSNAAITTSVYSGSTFVKSQTINASREQVFLFTVSSGAVYTLSTTAFMNGFTANSSGSSITLSANPFPPRTVALTISSSDRGQTYRGAIAVTEASATPSVLNIYGYTKDGISTETALVNTFSADYNSSYKGYAYTRITTFGGTLSSSIAYSTVCNVSLSTPTNVQVDYNSTNITLTWSGEATNNDTNFYTVVTSNTTTLSSSISENIQWGLSKTYLFTGDVGNNYTFTVQGQSQRNPSASLIYSPPVSASVSLSTQSVNPSADYSGTKITVSFGITNLTTLSSQYTFGVTCVCGSVTNPGDYPNTYPYQSTSPYYAFTANGLSQILRFSVQPLLKGILGPATYTNFINLTTSAMTNVTQSYTGTNYTISWTPITHTPGYTYTVQDVSGSGLIQTGIVSTVSSASFTLSYGRAYHFQTYSLYKGISSAVTDLSMIYTYTNPVLGTPTTTYTGTTITVSWAAAIQADGYSATSYLLENIYYSTIRPITICSAFVGLSYQYIGTTGSDYTFAVTARYNGFDASIRAVGDHIALRTNKVSNVQVTNSGRNIFVSWSASLVDASSQKTIFYTLSQIGNGTLTAGDSPGRFTTSATVYSPVTTLDISETALYNYVITASANGILSSEVSATTPGLIFTYPPTNVRLAIRGDDTRTSHVITSGQSGNVLITPTVTWNATNQTSSATYTISLVDISVPSISPTNVGQTNTPGVFTWTNPPGDTAINLKSNLGHSVVPYVYATNNGLASESISGSPVRVYTAPPGIVGYGFDGLYRITFNLCRGATDIIPDYYTIWERNDAYKTNTGSGEYPLSYFTVSYQTLNTVYTIPLTGIQGYTYNFAIYSTLCGVASELNTTLSNYTLETTPVTTTAVSYSGTTITFSWSEAMQVIYTGATAKPNVGYTIYVTPGNPFIPLINAYKNLSYRFVGTPGQSYYFTIEAVNNNITSQPTQSGVVTLYQPVVTNLEATNTCENDRDVSMILTWTPDILNASGAQYRAVAFNQTTGATVTSNNIGINAYTVTFTGSIGVAYTFFVQGIYSNICGLAQSVEISNARPVITSFSLTNLGNNIFAEYTVTPVGSTVTLSAAPTSLVTSISYISATTATIRVTSTTSPGTTYSISATARYFGIPSTVCGATYNMTQPAKPSPVTSGYNNALVSVSWATAANASTYTFSAYDLSTNEQADIQTYIPQTYTTFIGTLGHSYNLSVTAYSSTYIPSITASSAMSIVIPPPPVNLSLYNVGSLVTVRWTDSTALYSNYSFTVVNTANPGTIFYQSTFASVSDTFLATVGQTFRVSLCGTSYCNVTSTSSAVSSLFIYQPSITSVTATNVGADITLIFPPDPRTCEYYVTNNYGYKNLLYSSTKTLADISAMYNSLTNSYAQYTQPTNGYISYVVANCSYNLVGAAYLFTVVPYYQLVSGQGARTPTVNPVTLYKPTLPTNVSVTSTGNTINLNWQYAEIYTSPANTAIATYKLEYSVADSSGGRYSLSGTKYPVGTTQSITGYDSGANAVSISLTAVIPSYDPAFGGNYIYGYTYRTSYTIPNLQSISIQQRNGAVPTELTVTIPQTPKPYIWFYTVAKNNVNPAQVPTTYPVVSNVQANVGNTQTDYKINVSLGYYYTISAYGYDYSTGLNPDSIGVIPILPNPNPYPATTFNVSALSIFTSHSGLTTTISWSAVTGAEYYYIQEFPDGRTGAGDVGDNVIATTTTLSKSFTHTDSARSKTFCYQITAVTPSGATYTNTQDKGISLSNSINALFSPSPFSGDETLTVPGVVQSLTATQSLTNIIVTWSYPQNIVNLTRSASSTNTSFAITQTRNSLSSGTTTALTYTFPLSPTPAHGTLFSYGVTPTYFGITGSAQTASPEPLTFVNPAITALTLTNNHNKTITLAGTANTPGKWFANIGSAASPPAAATATDSTTFSLNQTVTVGSSWTGFVTFVATTGGLSVTSNTAAINIQTPTFGTPVLTNNSSTLGASFTLTIATTGASAAGVINSWSIPTNDSTGTFSNTTSTLNSSNLTAVYQAKSRPWVTTNDAPFFESNTIVLTSDGFAVSNAKTSNFIPPALVITATLGPTGAPAALNLGLNFTSNGTATSASLNFPSTISGLSTSTSSPQSASSCNITYSNMLANTLYSTAATSVFATFQEYKTFAATTSAQVRFSITDISFADNRDGTMKITATRGDFSGGSGTPRFIAPTAIGTLSIIGDSSSQVTPATFTYGTTTDTSQYTLNANAVSLVYSGITLTGPAAASTVTARFPLVQNLTATHFGCIEDGPLTGVNSITVTASANINSTWTITACSALTLNSSSGQGTTQIIFNFSGGRKGSNYSFTVGTCNVSVSLTKPSANVTPSFSSFVGSPNITGVTTSIANSSGSTFVFLGATNATDTAATITLNTQSVLASGIYTVSAAAVSNGIIGNISSYQFAICPAPSALKWGSGFNIDDKALSEYNKVNITFAQGENSTIYSNVLVSNTTSPTSPASGLPTGAVVTLSSATQRSTGSVVTTRFVLTLPQGAQSYYIATKFTTNGQDYYSSGTPLISFTYTVFSDATLKDRTSRSDWLTVPANTKTWFDAILVAGGGAGGGAGEAGQGNMRASGGGAGGAATVLGFRGIVSGDRYIFGTWIGGGGQPAFNSSRDGAEATRGGTGGSVTTVAGNSGGNSPYAGAVGNLGWDGHTSTAREGTVPTNNLSPAGGGGGGAQILSSAGYRNRGGGGGGGGASVVRVFGYDTGNTMCCVVSGGGGGSVRTSDTDANGGRGGQFNNAPYGGNGGTYDTTGSGTFGGFRGRLQRDATADKFYSSFYPSGLSSVVTDYSYQSGNGDNATAPGKTPGGTAPTGTSTWISAGSGGGGEGRGGFGEPGLAGVGGGVVMGFYMLTNNTT